VLIAYLDESGSKDTPILTMAGYIADERKWLRFEREWRKAMKEFGVTHLHMRQFTQSRGEFAGWSEAQRRAFMNRVTWIIKSSVMYRVGAVIPCADYQQTVGLVEPGNTRITPFWCSFLSCISAILAYCKRFGITDDIALVFDENSESSQHATGYYTSFKELPGVKNRSQLVSLSFADDKKFTPLQAADLLAYELNKYHRGFKRKPLEKLDGTPGTFAIWDRKMLEGYAASLRDVMPKQSGA